MEVRVLPAAPRRARPAPLRRWRNGRRAGLLIPVTTHGDVPSKEKTEPAGESGPRCRLRAIRGALIDRALRARHRDDGLKGVIVRYLAGGAGDKGLLEPIREAAKTLDGRERESQRLATRYTVANNIAFCDATERGGHYDKTLLLLLGQELARVSVVLDETTVTAAAAFDSGVDLVALLGLTGGMPTRVSVERARLDELMTALRNAH